MEDEGLGGTASLEDGSAHRERACSLGVARACSLQGIAARDATPADLAKAGRLLEAACDGGDADGCEAEAGLALKRLSLDSPERALERFIFSCARHHREYSCSPLRIFYHDGLGVARNPRRSDHYIPNNSVPLEYWLSKWANEGDARLHGERANWLPMLREKCDQRQPFACYWLFFIAKSGTLGQYPAADAIKWLTLACNTGSGDACERMRTGDSADPPLSSPPE